MEEKKLTDEQVLKALEICGNDGNCRDCPYRINNIECCSLLEKDSLAIINSLQVENKRLSDKAIALEVETNNQKAEIERLKNAKADGVRELLQELIEMEIKLDPLRSGIRYKALIGYAEENGVEVDL